MFHRIGQAAYKSSLDNTLKLDGIFEHPHRHFKTIHVAGTNGKGSVSHMLAAVFQSAGYKTGLYTSPHLKDFRERIKINGQMISKETVVKWVEDYPVKNNLWNIEPSFFELTVAMAFDYFAKQNVDIAIIEVGLGGRLDSTNIITPEVSVITNISLDHVNLLGDTLAKIASEKAGIIKKDIPVVIGTTQFETKQVFQDIAQTKQTSLFFADQEYVASYSMIGMDGRQMMNIEKNGKIEYPEIKLDLLGMYQLKNVPVVLKTVDILVEKGWKISKTNFYDGLHDAAKITGLMGRWQIIGNNPLIICDTGHNEDGIEMVINQLKNTAYKTLHFVFGVVADKNQDAILGLLPTDAVYYFTRADIPRAMNEKELAKKAAGFCLKGESYSTVSEAYSAAKLNAGKNDLIFVGGSTFVVAEIL
ncbi:MAG TPA: folylpolyglutamate synthase/dihydrofolate synthase family protein [Draconibacterium sp.]|nr:folylpolyglutamate synthase/dihydrofolate synthase family protein [Draconibacterium sp.]